MPGNHSSPFLHYYAGRQEGLVGHLWSPGKTITCYRGIEYALDNGKFASTAAGRKWELEAFIEHLERAVRMPKRPLWAVVPDVPFNAAETIALWQEWEPKLRKYEIPLAFALQNGVRFQDIPESAECWFIAGTDDWRYPRLQTLIHRGKALGKIVHVGRINGNRIWQCDRYGADSSTVQAGCWVQTHALFWNTISGIAWVNWNHPMQGSSTC